MSDFSHVGRIHIENALRVKIIETKYGIAIGF